MRRRPRGSRTSAPSLGRGRVRGGRLWRVRQARARRRTACATLPFPDYVLLSLATTPTASGRRRRARRLRNVIVTMEWVPDAAALAARDEEAARSRPRAGVGAARRVQAARRRRLEGARPQGGAGAHRRRRRRRRRVGGPRPGRRRRLGRPVVRRAARRARHLRLLLDRGGALLRRAFAEAESRRALLHATAGGALLPASNATLALRCDRGGVPTLLDASDSFAPAAAALSAQRGGGAALRRLARRLRGERRSTRSSARCSPRPCEEARPGWLQVRSCRRRRDRREWQQSTIAQVFSVASQFDELKRTALIARTRIHQEAAVHRRRLPRFRR